MGPGAYGSAINAWGAGFTTVDDGADLWGSAPAGAVTAPPPGSFGDTVAPDTPAPGYDTPAPYAVYA